MVGGAVVVLSCSGEASTVAATGPRASLPSDAGALDASNIDGAAACGSLDAGWAPAARSDVRRGEALSVGELTGIFVPVWDETGESGIDGPAFLVQSQLGDGGPVTTPATFSAPPGKLCMVGNTVIVPLMNLTDYWGAEIEVYLNASIRSGVAGAVAPEAFSTSMASGWDPAAYDVIGFSFVVEGNNPALPCGGLPPELRFEAAPAGGSLSADIFCHRLGQVVSGATQDVLFSELIRDCEIPGGAGIFDEPRPPGFTGELQNIQWAVPADERAGHAFDLCISDIRPILAN